MKKSPQTTAPAAQIKQKTEWTPYLLILPAVVLIFGVMLYPLCKTFYLAFQNYNPTTPYANGFAGFGKNFKGRGFFRALVFIPWAMSGVLTAVLFNLIYNQNYGVLNDILTKMGLIDEPVAWLANTHLVLGAVIVAELWRGIPFFAISLLAAMQGLPQDVYEAAKVDGATKLETFRSVTLPLLKDTIVLTTLLRTIWEFNSVDLIFSLTNGGPVGKTTTLSMLIANQALTTNNYGYGSAISVVSFLILTIIAIIYMKASGFAKGSES